MPELFIIFLIPSTGNFFVNNNGESPLQYNQISRPWTEQKNQSASSVTLRREYTSRDIDHLTDLVLNGSPEKKVGGSGLYFKSSSQQQVRTDINERRILFESRLKNLQQ